MRVGRRGCRAICRLRLGILGRNAPFVPLGAQRAVDRRLEPTAVVAGSSPAGPTTHSFEPRDFPETAKEPGNWRHCGAVRFLSRAPKG